MAEQGSGDEKKLVNRKGRRGAIEISGKLSKILEEEMVDGWPKWLVDSVPTEVLAEVVPKSAESYKMIDKVSLFLITV